MVSYQNILATGKIGVISMRPRCSETLRISGRAELVTDPDLCARLQARGRAAILLLKITVTEAYFHCGKAFIRNGLWQTEAWPDKELNVSFGREIGDQIGRGKDFVEDLDAQVVELYKDSL